MKENKDLMPIGRFSKSCRLSIKTLRYYDKEGLLNPAFVDQQTGYRYYSHAQAQKAIMIAMLRSLDISLSQVRTMLECDKVQLKTLLNREQQRIEVELARQQQALQSIKRIAQAGELIPYDIAIRHEPDYAVCQRSCKTTMECMIEDSANLIYALFDELQTMGRTYEHPVMCIYEDPDSSGQIIMHACVGVSKPFPQLNLADITSIDGGSAAWLTHHGSYLELGIAYHSLFAWAQQRGYEPRAAMREIYLNDPANTPDEQLITEVILPIRT